MPDPSREPPRVRTVGETVDARVRERRAADQRQSRRRGSDRHPRDPSFDRRARAGLIGRFALFVGILLLAYILLRQLTYVVFAPELEVIRPIVPDGGLTAGEPVTLGVVVRNRGPLSGASFVVAVTGDVETEGPTLDVPPRDTAFIPVRVTLNSGTNAVSLVVFDGWRGVRELRAYRNLSVGVEPRSLDIQVTEQVARGQLLTLAIPWSNPGMSRETVVPVVVFRPEVGGAPQDQEGPTFQLEPGESRTLDFAVETWSLRAGRYTLEVYLETQGRERLARGISPHSLEVTEP
jgi:hypothetical protein